MTVVNIARHEGRQIQECNFTQKTAKEINDRNKSGKLKKNYCFKGQINIDLYK